jgi:hypothetical protein
MEKSKQFRLALHLVEMDTDPNPTTDPDRQALDANPYPLNDANPTGIQIHNTLGTELYRNQSDAINELNKFIKLISSIEQDLRPFLKMLCILKHRLLTRLWNVGK